MNIADPVVDEYARAAERYDEKWAFYLEATTRETGPADARGGE